MLLKRKPLDLALFCKGCGSEVGWYYNTTPDDTQRYKECKSILEKVRYTSRCLTDWTNLRYLTRIKSIKIISGKIEILSFVCCNICTRSRMM